MNSLEIIDERNLLTDKLEKLIETGKVEERKLTEIEDTEFVELTEQIKELDIKLENIENENKRNFVEIQNKKQERKIMKEFNLISVINDVVNNRSIDENYQDVINAGKEEMRKSGLNFSGQIQLPIEERADITATGNGATNVPETKLNILEPLRGNLTLTLAGAQVLTGLIGDVSIPTYSGSAVLWKGETASAEAGEGSFGEVLLSPKRLTATIDVSKQFLAQDSNDAQSMLMRDIVNAISAKLESTILGSASGTTTQPAGLFYGATTGVTASYTGITSLESDLEDLNVINYKFIVSPKAKFALKGVKINEGKMVFYENQIDGVDAYSTSNAVSKGILVFDPSDLVIGQFGALDITVDPYTKAADGKIRLIVNFYVDAKMRRNSYKAIVLA